MGEPMTVTSPHQRAREYCEAIGKDPDELVWGADQHGARIERPRWAWMLGASAETAEGATELSPTQRAVVEGRRGRAG